MSDRCFEPHLNEFLKTELELQTDNALNSLYLLSYNIKPRDVLEMIPQVDLNSFILAKQIKSRGDLILNILEAYKDSANLYLENYENIGFRNLAALKENGILIKESDLGIKFEELTKSVFTQLVYQNGIFILDVANKFPNSFLFKRAAIFEFKSKTLVDEDYQVTTYFSAWNDASTNQPL